MTLGEVSKLAPDVPWVDYVNNLLRAAGHQVSQIVCRRRETSLSSLPPPGDYIPSLSSLSPTGD